jgi:hypothetical protein
MAAIYGVLHAEDAAQHAPRVTLPNDATEPQPARETVQAR